MRRVLQLLIKVQNMSMKWNKRFFFSLSDNKGMTQIKDTFQI